MIRTQFTFVLIVFLCQSFLCRDILIEFKGACFLPTSSRFRDCYKGSLIYGSELMMQLHEKKKWYCFASVDCLKRKGQFLSLCDSSRLQLILVALGVKYFFRFSRADFYAGLGFQVSGFSKKNRNKYVTSKKRLWGFGGIGKFGTYIYLSHNFLLDLFCNYSFAWTGKTNFYGNRTTCLRTNGSAVIPGAGIGYRF